jgi:hypothetical protein
MGDNFMLLGASLTGSGGRIVIALDMEDEETSALLHLVVDRLILIELLEVE